MNNNNEQKVKPFSPFANLQIPVSPEEVAAEQAKRKKKGDDYVRATYYLTKEHVEAVKIIRFREDKSISEIIRELLEIAIPKEIMEEAKKNVKEREERTNKKGAVSKVVK